MKNQAPDFWKKVAETGSLPTTETPVSASTNIADFWKKVREGGSLPTTATALGASATLPDFWQRVAAQGAVPVTSTLVEFANEADYWAYVAANGVMPISVGNVYTNATDLWRAIVTGTSGGAAPAVPSYLWDDEFLDDVAAGLVSMGAANPGPGTWFAVDSNSKLTQTGGKMSFATGGAGEGNPGAWLPLTAREAGRIIIWEVTLPDTAADHASIGLDTAQSGAIQDAIKFSNTGLIRAVVGGTTAFTVGLYTATTYYVAAVLRTAGVIWLIKGGAYAKWTLIWKSNITTAGVYPSIQAAGVASIFTSDFIRSPETLWTTIPVLASDSFNRADGVAGNTDGLAIPEAGGSGLAWSRGAISSDALVLSPTLGAEIHTQADAASDPNSNEANATTGWTSTGTLTADSTAPHNGTYNIRATGKGKTLNYPFTAILGQWYEVDLWIKSDTPLVFSQIQQWSGLVPAPDFAPAADSTWQNFKATARCSNTSANLKFWIDGLTNPDRNVEVDNLTIKPVDLTSYISSLILGTPDVIIKAKVSALTARTQAGVITRLDSDSDPQNFIIVYYDGYNRIKADECVNGVYAPLYDVGGFAWEAGNILTAHLSGSTLRIYESRLAGGGGQQYVTSVATNVVSGNLHGVFSTNAANKVNYFSALPAGSGDEFIALDTYLETPIRSSKWSELRAMPAIRADNTMAVYDGKIYSFGGYTPQFNSPGHADTYEYDPATDLWTAKTDMPTARWGMVAVTVGDKIHVFGGNLGNSTSTLKHEIYDPIANTWDVTKADMPAGLTDQGLMAVLYGTKIHLFFRNTHYEYNPADDTYTAKANVPVGVTWGTCAVVGTKIYVIGGYSYDAPTNATDVNQIYDTVANTWSSGAVMPDKLYGQTRENPVINGLIYCTHGQDEDSLYYTTVHIYNPATNTWTTDSDSAVYPRDGVGCVVFGGKLYVTGGRTGSVQHWWHEVYTP